MNKIKKIIYCLALVILGTVTINAQESNRNLLTNGDFKNGSAGWNLGADFTLGGDSSYPYVQTGYVSSYGYPSIATQEQVVTMVPGATYRFSFWGYNLGENDMNSYISLKNSANQSVTLKDVPGVSYNTFYYKEVDNASGWKQFAVDITFPKNQDVVKLEQFRISLIGSNKSYKRITEISMEKIAAPKPKAPENFKVADNMLFQRAAQLIWDKEEGKTYKVEVNGQSYELASGKNTLYLNDLVPNTNYTATVYDIDNPDVKANLDFKTKDYIEANAEERVPFLSNVEGNKITRAFMYHIADLTGEKIIKLEVMYGGSKAEVLDGVVTLPASVNNGDLVIKITQEGDEVTTINYKSITIKQ